MGFFIDVIIMIEYGNYLLDVKEEIGSGGFGLRSTSGRASGPGAPTSAGGRGRRGDAAGGSGQGQAGRGAVWVACGGNGCPSHFASAFEFNFLYNCP